MRAAIGLVLAATCARGPLAGPGAGEEALEEARLHAMRVEIEQLRIEMEKLQGQEKGILGDLERLEAKLRLREAEVRESSARLRVLGEDIDRRSVELARLELAQRERHRYLAFRLREIYKRGPEHALRKLVGGEDAGGYLAALRYAAYLSERDVRLLRSFREDGKRLVRETEALVREQRRLSETRTEAERMRSALERSRRERARVLAGVRRDRARHREAIEELEAASAELGRLVEGLGGGTTPALDVTRFRGLLDWPAEGSVSGEFGRSIHPRFRTVVPHPGLDIEASAGTDFRSVFDGTVAFSSWLRGYGLTAIVDHGHGLVSVYAHASVLLVESGEAVSRRQPLGKVGETGSLRGPYLYFELRQDGRTVDPRTWLRPR